MSMAQASTDECKECGDEIDTYYTPGYCSERCYYLHTADKYLSVARSDHRICGSCLRFIKEVERPTDDWSHKHGSKTETALENGGEYHNIDGVGISLDVTDCYDASRTSVESVIGYQYRTENAETAIKEFDGPRYTRIRKTGTGCICGNTDPNETHDILQDTEPATVLANFVKTFRYLERESKVDTRISKEVLFESYRETRDLTLSLGRALE